MPDERPLKVVVAVRRSKPPEAERPVNVVPACLRANPALGLRAEMTATMNSTGGTDGDALAEGETE